LSDITERRKSEEVLRNSEKLAATGRLAHTIAHEINNPLAALTNLLYLARSEFESGLPVGQYLELAQQEVNRISRITRQTLSLHRESASPIQVDVSGILRDVVELLRPKADEAHVSVELETRDNAGIQGYPGELRQAFLNFVVNAVEAAPAGGRVLVRSHRSAAWSNGSLPGVRITISDDGAGIPDEVKGQIFEAFFTTKDLKGSGLGLWLSNSIIVKHHGSVRFRTRTTPPSTGTCFNIFLPRS
jgi:signal transduction histidine kinase